MIVLVSIVLGQLLAPSAQAQCATNLSQDLNCNTIGVRYEQDVDFDDPICALHTGGEGEPNSTTDSYYDYFLYGCSVPTYELDVDSDGFSYGLVEVPDAPDGLEVFLACDNCPEDFNPGQEDEDCDEWGDICDNCVYAYNPDQANADTDELGDVCDNCPEHDNPDQAY